MSPYELATYIRFKTSTDYITFTDSDMLALVNIFLKEISNKLNDANEDTFGIVIENDLEALKRNYSLDQRIMSKIKYFEASFDGVEYKRLTEYNLNTIGITTDNDAIKTYMQGKDPGYYIFGSEIFILSDDDIIDVTNGLKMHIIAFPDNLTDLTSTTDMSTVLSETAISFPLPFHELLARRVIMEFKSKPDRKMPFNELELNYKNDLQEAIDLWSDKGLDREIEASAPYDDGQDY